MAAVNGPIITRRLVYPQWGDACKQVHDQRPRNPSPGLKSRMENERNQRKRRRTERDPNLRHIAKFRSPYSDNNARRQDRKGDRLAAPLYTQLNI